MPQYAFVEQWLRKRARWPKLYRNLRPERLGLTRYGTRCESAEFTLLARADSNGNVIAAALLCRSCGYRVRVELRQVFLGPWIDLLEPTRATEPIQSRGSMSLIGEQQ
jgi:hypothetical protein